MPHISSVDEEIVLVPASAHGIRPSDESFDFHERSCAFEREEFGTKTFAEYVYDALTQPRCRQVHHLRIVVIEFEGNRRMHECNALELGHDVAKFRFVRFEKLTAYRNIVEQVFNRKNSSLDAGIGFDGFEHGAADREPRSQFGVSCPRAQFNLRHCCDRGQRLAAKAHCAQGIEVFCIRNLRGGVTLKSHAGIGLRHAFAVVCHLYKRTPCVLDIYDDLRRLGIDCVLHQLFYDRGRSLNDFAGCDLVGDMIG